MRPVFLRERNDAQSVVECLDWLEGRLGPETFRELLQVVLTDNGGEFTLVDRMEAGKDGSRRIGRLFFCNPYSSWQKGRVENNHRILRRVLPRGTSFDSLDQDRVNLPVPHVNSMPRAEYNDVPALETFGRRWGRRPSRGWASARCRRGRSFRRQSPSACSPPPAPSPGGTFNPVRRDFAGGRGRP